MVLVVGIFFVFFWGKTTDLQTQKKSSGIVSNGIEHFRKGLDVSWGTRLVYQISYDKYEQTYAGKTAQLAKIKKEIEDILFKQIDKRISNLGVADAKVYKQTVGEKTYINVDIGGISDLDQAKALIGKTVELEFRLPFAGEVTPELKLVREQKAGELLANILENPTKIKALTENKGAESIFYTHFTGTSLEQLPVMLKENANVLEKTSEGKVFDQLIKGVFTYQQTPNQSGNVVLTPIEGFGIMKMNSKKENKITAVTFTDIETLAKKLSLQVTKEEKILDTAPEKKSFVKDATYNNYDEIAGAGKTMYKVKVAFVAPSLSGNDTTAIVDAVAKQIKTSSTLSGAMLLMDNEWKTEDEIKTVVSAFNPSDSFKVYEEMNGQYIVYTSAVKSEKQYLYNHVRVANVPTDFEERLTKKTIYDIELVFVQDHEPWVLAKTQNNKILNGAYFKYANAGSSSLGEAVVEVRFNDEGKQVFCDITNENVNKQMAIFVGGNLMTNPVIRTKICGGTAQISGNYTPESAKALADELNDGALPAPLILLQEEKVSPVLGDNALKNALLAGLVGIVAIFVYMIVLYWWKKAVVSVIVLGMFLISLGMFMKIVPGGYSLSLSAIAAIILSLGMAVDANILIFERMNEEAKKTNKIATIIDNAYERSWLAIRDGNVSTFLIAFLLFQMGSGLFKGFGTTLIVTVLITLLVNVPLTKELLLIFYNAEKKENNKK